MNIEPEPASDMCESPEPTGGLHDPDRPRSLAPVPSNGADDDARILPSGAGIRPENAAEFLRLVREDSALFHRAVLEPGFWAVALHRFRGWTRSESFPRALRPAAGLLYKAARLVVQTVFGISLPSSVQLGRRVKFAHQHGIVIHPHASIGDDCVIRQGVSLGAGGDNERFRWQAPQLGRGVSLGAGCVIVGRVTIGDGATIGPNAVVITHIPAGAMVLAQNPRIIRPRPPGTAQRPDTAQ